jgi:ureidoglycolate lyase
MRLRLEELTESSFRAFGQVLVSPSATRRNNFAADLVNRRPDRARPNLAVVRADFAAFPLEIGEIERHEYSSQAFMPLDVKAYYMVVVCEDDGHGDPNLATLRGFRVPGTVGVNYNCGVWHLGMLTIGEPGTFAMLIFEAGNVGDCTFRKIMPVIVEPKTESVLGR